MLSLESTLVITINLPSSAYSQFLSTVFPSSLFFPDQLCNILTDQLINYSCSDTVGRIIKQLRIQISAKNCKYLWRDSIPLSHTTGCHRELLSLFLWIAIFYREGPDNFYYICLKSDISSFKMSTET